MKETITFSQLKKLVKESEIDEARNIPIPDFDEDDALDVLYKVFNRAKFLGLSPFSYHSSSKWNGWRFDGGTVPEYRAKFLCKKLMEDVKKWIANSGLEGVIRIGGDNWLVWPNAYLPNGNRIRSQAKKHAGDDPTISAKVKIPYKGLQIEGDHVVDYIGSDSHLVIPDGIKQIEPYVFAFTQSLKTIQLPDSLEIIDYCSFCDSGIEEIHIPDGVKELGSRAFMNCIRLKTVNIPKSITGYVYDSVFAGCTSLKTMTIPDEVNSEKIDIVKAENAIYNDSKTVLYCAPKDVSGSFEIPSTVQTIHDRAFSDCSGLTSVTIPDGVTSIESNAFRDCSGLTSLTIPDSVTSIGGCAFENCSKLTSVLVPDGVTDIWGDVFAGCSSLKSVTLPTKLKKISGGLFYFCSSLESIVIPDGVTEIGYTAFRGCSTLTSMVIPDSVTSIEWCAFDGCSGLTSVTIPDNVTKIDWGAFQNCTKLAKVKLPSGLFEEIIKEPDRCFKNTPWAEKVKNGGLSFDVDDKGTLDKYDGHDTVITIPDEVHVIGAGAFFGNDRITKVTIPDTVTVIEPGAFENCEALETIVLGVGIKKIEKDTFKNVSDNITIYVPDFDMCKLLLDSGLPDSATVIIGKGSSRRRLSWDPEK